MNVTAEFVVINVGIDLQERHRLIMIRPLVQGRRLLPMYLTMQTPGQNRGSAS